MNRNNKIASLMLMASMYAGMATNKRESYVADYEPIKIKGSAGVCKHTPKNRRVRLAANRKARLATIHKINNTKEN